jgi:hypothetical protein
LPKRAVKKAKVKRRKNDGRQKTGHRSPVSNVAESFSLWLIRLGRRRLRAESLIRKESAMKITRQTTKVLIGGLVFLATLGLAAVVWTQVCVTPPAGLVSWWPGDGNANDIFSGNHGTLQGGAAFAAGRVGQAFSFDGINDFMKIGQPLSLTEGTVDFWIKRRALTAEGGFLSDVFIGSVDLAALPNRAPTFFVRSSETLMWEFGDLVVQDTGKPLPVGEWHHLAMTWKRNPEGSHSIVVYLDGTAVDSGVATGVTGFADLLVGAYNLPNPIDQFANAIIDELEVYNRALSQAEIQAIFNARSAGKCTNQPPVANNQSVTTNEDTAVSFNLTGSDPDNNPLTFHIVTGPSNGMVTGGTGAARTYTPNANFFGTDSFTFKVNDGSVDSNVATVSITVNEVNDPPSFDVIGNQAVPQNAPSQNVTITGVFPGPANEAGQTVNLTATSSNTTIVPNPTVSGTGATRTLTYQPATNQNGVVTITVTANDGQAVNNTFSSPTLPSQC